MQHSFENDFAFYSIEGNIVHIVYKPGLEIDLAAAIQIVRDRIAFQEELPYPVLCDIRQLRKVDKPARNYLALEGSVLVKALAFVIEPPVTDAMTQFYFRTNNPSIPTGTYRKMEQAIEFLKKYLGLIALIGCIPF